MRSRESSPAPAATAVTVESDTHLAVDPGARAAFEQAIQDSPSQQAIFQGAFATNVWGGRYEIERMLAEGAQGTTFAGTDRKTGAKVAVKVFSLKDASDWKAVDLFDREVAALKALKHDQIPRFVDVIDNQDAGTRALVMTLMPGKDLAQVVADAGPLEEAQLWRLMVDVVDVLSVLHGQKQPIVHRDIKPKNLVLRPDGKVGVVDFGGVGRLNVEGGSTIVGTFGYMAPEQLYGSSTPRGDLYALGATLLSLATGKEPEQLPRDGLRLDVDKAAPTLSVSMRGVLKRLLEPDPNDRPQNAKALRRELEQLARRPDDDKRSAKKSAQARATDETPWADARWPETSSDEASAVISGIAGVVIGVLGIAAVTIFGEVLIPVACSLVAGFSHGTTRKRALELKAASKRASWVVKRQFEEALRGGTRTLNEVDHRDRRRRIMGREQRREQRKRRKHEKNQRRGARRQAKKRDRPF